MGTKIVIVFFIICAMQEINTKSIKQPKFTNDSIFSDEHKQLLEAIQQTIVQTVTETKATIGKTIGLTSGTLGIITSQMKNHIKIAIEAAGNNQAPPETAPEDCKNAREVNLNKVKEEANRMISGCAAQGHLNVGTLNILHRELSMRVSMLNWEANMLLKQCRLQNPIDNDAMIDCLISKGEGVLEKIHALQSFAVEVISSLNVKAHSIIKDVVSCGTMVKLYTENTIKDNVDEFKACAASGNTVVDIL